MDRLKNACDGKSETRGGMNMPEFSKKLIELYPNRENDIKKPSIRAAIMVATILATKGSKPVRANPLFYQILIDVIGSEISYENEGERNYVLTELIEKELDKYTLDDRK